MTVRNWWIIGEIDDKEAPIAGGPRQRGGGFHLTIQQRDQREDKLETPAILSVHGECVKGELILTVIGPEGQQVLRHITRR